MCNLFEVIVTKRKITKAMNNIPKIVLENPFRILGVFANATKKEIVANQGKANAFLKVGRPVEYPLDLGKLMPSVNRSVDIFSQANAHLTIAKEQLKYAQFWFLKMIPLDDVAFNHLYAGNWQQAIEIWDKKNCVSSLQNKVVTNFITNNFDQAVNTAEDLYDQFSDDFLKAADTTGTLNLDKDDLIHSFIDTLCAEYEPKRIYDIVFSDDWKDYLGSKTVKPLIDRINAEIKIAKDVDDSNPKNEFDAGIALTNNTKGDFKQLKSILPSDDPQLESIADKLGLQILQCAINYYNNSDDEDAAENAMALQKSASKIVMGEMAKDRCEDNGSTLKEIIDSLPPKSIRKDHNKVIEELKKFDDKRRYATISDSVTLLKNTKAPLQRIKGVLGSTNENYLHLSTLVVQKALSNIVQEVNDAQEGKKKKQKPHTGLSMSLLDAFADAFEPKRDLKQIVKEAVRATALMDEFDLDSDFRTHYNKNKAALKSLCSNLMIFPSASNETQKDIDSICAKISSPIARAGLFVPEISIVNECKSILNQINTRGDLSHTDFIEVSTMAVRGILNATISAVNGAQSRTILNDKKDELKDTVSKAISVMRLLNDFEMTSECRESYRKNSSTLSDINNRLNPGCLGSFLAIAASILVIIYLAL